MITLRRVLFATGCAATLSLAAPAFGSEPNIYITQSGSPTGHCTSNVHTPAFFNNAANWGDGATQIGPGTTVLLCGTFTSSVQGGNVLTVQGSGTPGNPVTILFDAHAQMNSTGWWGSNTGDGIGTGAITISGFDYVTVNGQGTGVIQNTLAGCVQGAKLYGGGTAECAGGASATCSAGPCTQSPGATNACNGPGGGNGGTSGIVFSGDHIIIENLTVRGMYMNAGTASAVNDTNGCASQGISGTGTNIQIANNLVADASYDIGVANPGGSGANTGPNDCPSAGVCIYGNITTDSHWHIAANVTSDYSGDGINNVYGNTIGDNGGTAGWLNWQEPVDYYHLDGIISFGYNHHPITDYIFNNLITGSQGTLGAGTGSIYCSSTQLSDSSGSSCYIYNNVLNNAPPIAIGQPDRCEISAWSIASDVLSMTVPSGSCSNGIENPTWPAGEAIVLTGFSAGSFLNGQTVHVTSSGSTVKANFTHANTSGSESSAFAYDAGNMGPYFLFQNSFTVGSGLINYTYDMNPPYYALTQKNNIWMGSTATPSSFEAASNAIPNWTGGITSNNNIYFNDRASLFDLSNSSWWLVAPGSPNTAANNFAAWKVFCGDCDGDSAYEDPLISNDGALQAGSPAIGFGANLTSLGIDSLNADKNGVARPSSGSWDVGAYQYCVGDCGAPRPPTNLTATIE
jgi:hypothetical protein